MKSKFQFLLPLILTIISINSLKLTHNKAESTEINPVIIGDKKSEILPGTPKAMTLKNHFGAKPEDSPYGPQPTLIKKLVTTQYPDGSFKRENQTEIIHLQEGIISECDIAKQEFYPICFNLKSCDLCASNPYCGNLFNKNLNIYYNFKDGVLPHKNVSLVNQNQQPVQQHVSIHGYSTFNLV